MSLRSIFFALALSAILYCAHSGLSQVVTTGPATMPVTAVGGINLSADGVLRMGRVTTAVPRRRGEIGMTYVSLAGAINELRGAAAPPAKDLLYLKGLTRIDYLFVYPDEHDLVIAGPSEPVNDANLLEPVGTVTGRPLVQLEDLIVALRAVGAGGKSGHGEAAGGQTGGGFYGCSLDIAGDAQAIAEDVGRRYGAAPRGVLAEQLKNALGPQQVRIIGVPADSRVALAMVTADYRLKRMSMGLDPAAGVGNAVGQALAVNRVWFEPAYQPLGVSADGLSYHLAGPRLKVLAGAQEFTAKDATPAAAAFAKRFSDRMEETAGRVSVIADLQNLADLFLVATLIRQDGLVEKAGIDFSWVMKDSTAGGYGVTRQPVPRTAETMVNDTGGMIVQGGVALAGKALLSARREVDAKAAAKRDRPTLMWYLVKK